MEIQIEAKPHGHKYITQNTVNAILGKEPLIAPGTEGLNSVQLANAILLSGIRGRTVEVPVCEDEFDELLEELRADERRHAPHKVFDWEAYINSLRQLVLGGCWIHTSPCQGRGGRDRLI